METVLIIKRDKNGRYMWTGGGKYWPGEIVPDTEMVHRECEDEETARAWSLLTQDERNVFLRTI